MSEYAERPTIAACQQTTGRSGKSNFPRLDDRRIDIASRWAIRWLVRYNGQPRPSPRRMKKYLKRLHDAYLDCGDRLRLRWIVVNTLAPNTWRQELRNLKRNPKRLRVFASDETLAQLLRYGAARADATDDLEALIQQMEQDPAFFEKILHLISERDIQDRKKRFLDDVGGRPDENSDYMPIIDAAAVVFKGITDRRLGRSTSSATKSDIHAPGNAIGPGIEFTKRLLGLFERDFDNEAIANLIRAARKSA